MKDECFALRTHWIMRPQTLGVRVARTVECGMKNLEMHKIAMLFDEKHHFTSKK
jgi:hypothetical protein